jgi:hypothetical protein
MPVRHSLEATAYERRQGFSIQSPPTSQFADVQRRKEGSLDTERMFDMVESGGSVIPVR